MTKSVPSTPVSYYGKIRPSDLPSPLSYAPSPLTCDSRYSSPPAASIKGKWKNDLAATASLPSPQSYAPSFEVESKYRSLTPVTIKGKPAGTTIAPMSDPTPSPLSYSPEPKALSRTPSAKSATIKGKWIEPSEGKDFPSPQSYSPTFEVESRYKALKPITIKGKPGDTVIVPQSDPTPSPLSYSPSASSVWKQPRAATISGKRVESSEGKDFPSPQSYTPSFQVESKYRSLTPVTIKGKPAGTTIAPMSDPTPSPLSYSPEPKALSHTPSAKAATIKGKWIEPSEGKDFPSPQSYSPSFLVESKYTGPRPATVKGKPSGTHLSRGSDASPSPQSYLPNVNALSRTRSVKSATIKGKWKEPSEGKDFPSPQSYFPSYAMVKRQASAPSLKGKWFC